MLQTLQDYEASVQELASNCQSIVELGIQVDQLVHTFNGQEELESLTQGQQKQVWEVETYTEEHNGELWKIQNKPNSFEDEHVNEDHHIKNLLNVG